MCCMIRMYCTEPSAQASELTGGIKTLLKLRKCTACCAALLVTLSSVFGQTSTGGNGPTLLQFPPIGLASTETAQVNVVNTALPPANGGVEPVCNGAVVYYDAAGNILGTLNSPTPPTTQYTLLTPNTFQLQPGQMYSAPLPFASTNAPGPRTVIRVIIYLDPLNVPTATGPAVAPCQISSSLETYDSATGVTHAIVSGQAALGVPGA